MHEIHAAGLHRTSSITYSRMPGISRLFEVRPRALWISCHAALNCRKMRFRVQILHSFPEFAELFVLKSRTESDARKKDGVIFVLISRTNFSRNFVRVLCATVREFSAVKMQSNPGKGLKTNKRDSGI
jgi:hypothetical protein